MKQIPVQIDKEKLEQFVGILKENLDCFIGYQNDSVCTNLDVTTDEWDIIKMAEKICSLKDYQEQTR